MTSDTLPLPTLLERQVALEADMLAQGIQRTRKTILDAQMGGRESETIYGNNLLAGAITPIADAIREYLKVSEQDGRTQIAALYLPRVSPEVAAFLAARVVLDGISRRGRLQAVAVRIGGMVEDEVRFRVFEEAKRVNPKTGQEEDMAGFVHVVTERLEQQSAHYGYKRRVLVDAMNKMGVEWTPWPKSDRLHLGVKLIELVETATGVVERQMFTRQKKKEYYLAATEVTLEWIKRKVGFGELMCHYWQPMIMPPVDWVKPIGGGYVGSPVCGEAHPLNRLKLVKTRNRQYSEELFSTDLALVYNSLNAIQRTAWKVNTGVLSVLVEFWRNGNSVVGGLPSRENEPKPTKPIDIDTNKDALKTWKRKASEAIKRNFKLGSKRLQVEQIIRTAEKFAPEVAIFFPHTLDFRGRVYAMPVGLNPQGNSVSKGLLTFANGKPILDQRSANWLAVHGANLWGHDKVSLEDRVAWVRENQERILMSARAPLDYFWWTEADKGEKAWEFLAFCFEWAGFVKEGFGFISCLPIALDGSCNGLQHFSAMLRDPIGGAATNLVPSLQPKDIYAVVAARTVEKLAASSDPMAAKWLAFGITRKTAKRPVMVVPYGGTRHSARSYILEHVLKRLEEEPGLVNPFGDNKALFKASHFLAGVLWDAIQETVVAARDAMNWLQKVSQVVSKYAKPITWTAPSGFKVQQAYPNVTRRQVKTRIAGSVVKLFLAEEQEGTIDKRRQAQGISPNFVHSLDASALMFTVDTATACGIDSFAMIHDSYGTLAADTEVLRECLRQSFCQMYQFDVLASFRDEVQAGLPKGVELPPLPTKGSLDINQVLLSDFFFA